MNFFTSLYQAFLFIFIRVVKRKSLANFRHNRCLAYTVQISLGYFSGIFILIFKYTFRYKSNSKELKSCLEIFGELALNSSYLRTETACTIPPKWNAEY